MEHRIRLKLQQHPQGKRSALEDKSESPAVEMAAGGTTLHGTSDQKFGAAQALKPYASKAVVYSAQFAENYPSSLGAPHAHNCLCQKRGAPKRRRTLLKALISPPALVQPCAASILTLDNFNAWQ
jgi:hypothetical protein